nr:nucleotidyltransferase [uncultured Devosia sp.]
MTSRLPLTANPFSTPLDRILAEVAFNVQLPPSLHRKATSRYKAVREFLEGTDAFEDLIEHFYPQGSMAIDATISNRGTDDEFDIDIVAQLGGRFLSMQPNEILDELFHALDGYQGLKVVRQTRCVTLYYADGMHLDITPALREANTPDRQSVITHSKGPAARADDDFVPMNAYGFASWFNDRTPFEVKVVEEFNLRWRNFEAANYRADADVDEVPDQTEFVAKSTATLALQLVKRYRNIRYAKYDGRVPPSVMLSCMAGAIAEAGLTLSQMLLKLCRHIAREIRAANERGLLLHVSNPAHHDDVFTDRWPENPKQQMQFARHLDELIEGLERAQEMSAGELGEWLREMFGDRVVSNAVERIAKEADAVRQGRHSYSPSGKVILPGVAAIAAPSIATAAPSPVPHTFFGDLRK